MNTSNIPQPIIRKIALLQAKAESAKTIGELKEAQAFSAAVNRLLIEHNITMEQVEYQTEESKEEEIIRERVNTGISGHTKMRRKRVWWMEKLARVVAEHNMCVPLLSKNSSTQVFVGTKTNAQVAAYIFTMLVRVLDTVSEREHRRAIRTLGRERCYNYRDGFRHGFIDEVWEMFQEQKEQAIASNSTALTIISDQLQRAQDSVDGLGTATESREGRWSSLGSAHGRKVARETGIGARGINSSTSTKQLNK